jgi:hypothetical protein
MEGRGAFTCGGGRSTCPRILPTPVYCIICVPCCPNPPHPRLLQTSKPSYAHSQSCVHELILRFSFFFACFDQGRYLKYSVVPSVFDDTIYGITARYGVWGDGGEVKSRALKNLWTGGGGGLSFKFTNDLIRTTLLWQRNQQHHGLI